MEIKDSKHMEREVEIDGLESKEDLLKAFDTIIDAAKAKKGKGFVSLMVGAGERRLVLSALRDYLKFKFGHCRLENVLKVVEEETI